MSQNKLIAKSQMFHLPFSERSNANTQRFSNAGFPCLYLSNSIYVCWEELNQPPINELQVSRFQQENFNLNILDISITARNLKFSRTHNIYWNEGGKYDYDFIAFWFLITWPLSLVSSLLVTNEKVAFKEEYIFPQFLLRWVKFEEGIDGIKYTSVKSNPYNSTDYNHFINYVFPPKDLESGNFCTHLKDSFKLSDPVSFEVFKISDPNFTFTNETWLKNVKHKVMIDIIRLEILKGYPMPYTHTLFGKMEVFLHNMEVDHISNFDMNTTKF